MIQIPNEIALLAAKLCQHLSKRGLFVVTAESCTGGFLVASLSRTPGSAECLVGSFVGYRASLKISALGVPAELIAARSVYCEEVSCQMAIGALSAAPEADIALAITGVAGPGPDQDRPAGLVYVSAARRGHAPQTRECHFKGDPEDVIIAAMRTALEMGVEASVRCDATA